MEAENIISRIESKLKALKARGYEVYLQTPTVTQLYLRRGRIKLINEARHLGYGIRILTKGFGMTSSNHSKDAQIEECIKNALFIADHSKPERFTFPTQKKAVQVDIMDKVVVNEPEEVVRDLAEQLVNIADKEEVELPFAKIKAYHICTHITNSEGLSRDKEETMLFIEVAFKTSQNGRLSEYWATRYSRRPKDISVMGLQRWAQLSKENLKAKMPKTEKLEVILPPSVVCDLLVPVVGFHCTSRALKIGISKFAEGEHVAIDMLKIVDDGLYPYGLQTSPFDDEGNPQSRTTIIENGSFRNFLYDQYYGLQFNKHSTGNGIRQATVQFFIDEKFSLSPTNQVSNLTIEPGNKSLEQLVSEASRGLLIHNFSWLNPDPVSGLFGSEIRNASLIQKGEIAGPVKGGLISGNVFDLIKDVTGISDEAEKASGQTAFCCVSPYLRFKNVQVAGD